MTETDNTPLFEYCSHLEKMDVKFRGAYLYPILLNLGNRTLLMCQQCGKAHEASILHEIAREAMKDIMREQVSQK